MTDTTPPPTPAHLTETVRQALRDAAEMQRCMDDDKRARRNRARRAQRARA